MQPSREKVAFLPPFMLIFIVFAIINATLLTERETEYIILFKERISEDV